MKLYHKEDRIRRRGEFLRFFKNGTAHRFGVCTVFRLSNTLGRPRLGVTVKAKVNSVQRNRLKRVIREVFRLRKDRIAAFDYNVVVPGQVRVDHSTAGKVVMALERFWSNENLH